MVRASFGDLVVELDNATPALMDISAYVTSFNGWTEERIIEEITGAGDGGDRWADINFIQKSEVELSGPMDTTADSLYDIAKNWNDGSERTLKLTFLSGETKTVECLKKRETPAPTRNALTPFTLVVQPTGAIT
jgi:hypothetical protein